MVFEKIVVDVLNRFLSDYIQDLDTSQLHLGIWGGDVVFKNLILKPTALNDLDLPIETIYGLLGKLILKIPWKNLYEEPVVVLVERLFIIAEPNLEVKYNPTLEYKKIQDEKHKIVEEFEMSRKLREEGGKQKPVEDTFTDKLISQILKNIQIKISNIHIRYEDKITYPGTPFAVGLTMHTLTFNTAEDVQKKPPWQIFKVMNLECLGLYWNCGNFRMSHFSKEMKEKSLEETIAKRGFNPEDFNYVFGPLYLLAQLNASQKPEQDEPAYSIPVMKIDMDMQRLDIQLYKQQFQCLVLLTESMDRMNRGLPYRKYRPFLDQYTGHAKEWWHFAYESIINEKIRRVKRNWDWGHIKGHRQVCKMYAKAFKENVRKKGRIDEETKAHIEFCEDHLDAFNIILVRKQIYFELELEEKQKQSSAQNKSWISRWWSGQSSDESTFGNIKEQFEKALDAREKKKLYDAIGIDKDAIPSPYPEEYNDYVASFFLSTIQIVILNDKSERISEFFVKSSRLDVGNRSKYSGLRMQFTIMDMAMFGKRQDDYLPILVEPKGDFSMLFEILYEMAPLDKTCDERLHLMANPLQIIYDDVTIESIIDVFTIASDDAQVLALADVNAKARIMNMKEMSTLGIQHALTSHTFFECTINILAPYIIIPFAGSNIEPRSTLTIDLGRFMVNTEPRAPAQDVKTMHNAGLDPDEILAKMIAQSYDSFIANISDVQIILTLKDDKVINKPKNSKATNLNIIQPVSIKITIQKCLIRDDPRLPAIKISGVLDLVQISFSDVRIVEMAALANSFQKPTKPSSPSVVAQTKSYNETVLAKKSSASYASLMQLWDKETKQPEMEDQGTPTAAQLVSLMVDFHFGELCVNLFKTVPVALKTLKTLEIVPEYSNKLISFSVRQLYLKMTQKTYDLSCDLSLGSIELLHYRKPQNINIINTSSKTSKRSEKLFIMSYVQVEEESPFFETDYKSTKQKIDLEFHILNLTLNQQSLTEIIAEAQILQKMLEDIIALHNVSEVDKPEKVLVKQAVDTFSRSTVMDLQLSKSSGTLLQKVLDYKIQQDMLHEITDLKVNAKIDEICLYIENDRMEIAKFSLLGLSIWICNKKSHNKITVKLKDIQVIDRNIQTIHKTMVEVVDGIALHCILIFYDLARTSHFNKNDMSVVANIGCIKIIFLNWFLHTLTEFANSFQSAQQVIKDTAAEAADVMIEQITDVHNPTRIQLNLHIKAPIVVVPINSKSLQVFIFDFGYITIGNKFLNLKAGDLLQSQVVIDEMSLQLEDLQMSRACLSKAQFVEREQILLRPTTFTMTIKRNLSVQWYTSVPDIDIFGKIKSIQILLSQSDYAMAMEVVDQNLTEGLPNQKMVEKMSKQSTSFHDSEWKLSKKSVDTIYRKSRLSSVTSDQDEPRTSLASEVILHNNLRFQFTLDLLTMDLFTGGTQFHTAKNMRFPRKGLARFSLLVLSVKGRQFSDESMTIDLLLCDCILDDTRSYRVNKISRYLQRSTKPKSIANYSIYKPLKSMLDLSYSATRHNIFLAIRVFSLNFILSMDYLMTIGDFFKSPESQMGQVTSTPSLMGREVSAIKSHVSLNTVKDLKEEEKDKSKTSMNIDLRLEQPDIILVESMDDINCNCIIMNAEMLVRYRTAGKQSVLTGSLKDLHIYTCIFDEERRDETMVTILKPCSINFLGSSPLLERFHVDVCVSDICIHISPALIHLFNKIMETMNREGVVKKTYETDDYCKMWETTDFHDSDFLFLCLEEENHINNEGSDYDIPVKNDKIESLNESTKTTIVNKTVTETCGLFVPSILISVEGGTPRKSLPLILVELKYEASAHNWSSQLRVYSDMWIKISYFNTTYGLWESIIEPVERIEDEVTFYDPWQIKLDLESRLVTYKQDTFQTRKISIISQESLEITISKTCLDVITLLQKTLDASASQESDDQDTAASIIYPYKILNDSGYDVKLLLGGGPFIAPGNTDYQEIILGNGAQTFLELRDKPTTKKNISVQNSPFQSKQLFLNIIIAYQNTELNLPLNRADQRYFVLPREGPASEPWALVSDVHVDDNVMTLTMRSTIQVYNHLMTAVDIYYVKRHSGSITLIGKVEEKNFMNIPIQEVYGGTGELYFSVEGYSLSTTPYSCEKLQSTGPYESLLQCKMDETEQNISFFIKVVGQVKSIYHELTSRHTSKSVYYVLKLRSSALFFNSLPVSVNIKLYSIETLLDPGELLQMPHVEPGKCVVTLTLKYLEKTWYCYHDIPNVEGLSVWTFEAFDSALLLELNLGIHSINKDGTFSMTLYCPYWMINNTGLSLVYMKSKKTQMLEMKGVQKPYMESPNILYHPDDFKGPLMFSFHAKNFFAKKSAMVRVENGEWSMEVPLDTPGSGGSIECSANNMIYELGISNTLTYNNLTKQIMFTPYFLLVNQSDHLFSIQEVDIPDAPWIQLAPKSVIPFWPMCKKATRAIRTKCARKSAVTLPITYSTPQTVLLRLDNSYGGVQVEVQVLDSSIFIMFQIYVPGMAPALVINHTEETLSIKDVAATNFRVLGPYQNMYFTWDNPSGPKKKFCCYVKNRKIMQHDLRRDGTGKFKVRSKQFIYWSSFLYDMQRIILFTADKSIAENSLIVQEDLVMDQVILSIYSIGFSFVNNQTFLDIMYMCFGSTGVLWEVCKMKSKRFKPLPSNDMKSIEESYRKYLGDNDVPGKFPFPRIEIRPDLEVDFELNMQLKPAQRKLRRIFRPGFWVELSTSKNELHLHCKINQIQVDNQLRECAFPVVLAVIGKKNTVVNIVDRPFLELSVVKRLIPHSSMQQYKYFKLLIQEFHVKLDIHFINAVMGMFESGSASEEEAASLFAQDLKLAEKELWQLVESGSQKEAKNFYDLLHFSPLKIHISFSLTAMDAAPTVITVLLQGIGVTLTEMHDVVLRLAFFERTYCMLSNNQLIGQAMSHYTSQAVKQAYVLMLGLDVLGNPFGLVVGYTKGVGDLFYEPLRGAIQGPNEFAEGLYLGVRSLFGHTIGGTAGAVSKITGAMGKGLAALTFDKEYQRRRRKLMSKPPANLKQNFIRGGKGLVMGVVDGVTGVFTKPVKGAREEGIKGFIKGIGKGAIGLVARPTTGIIDFAADTFGAVKRATDQETESSRIRLPRFMHPDGLLRPYCSKSAEGYRLLLDAEKGRYAKELYESHIWIVKGKQALMLTDERILILEKGDVFGTWRTLWSEAWPDVVSVEQNSPDTVRVAGTAERVLILPQQLVEDFLTRMDRLRNEVKFIE